MKGIDDGVIKYDRSNFTYLSELPLSEYSEIEYWRKKLFSMNLIGVCPESNIGFGNISNKFSIESTENLTRPQFIISGTQTGKFPELDAKKYTRVIDFNILELKIHVNGPIEASSEALTHASIYESNSNINSVIHIHSKSIWNGVIRDQGLGISDSIQYGTVDMALAAGKITKYINSGYFAMEGHVDGVIAFSSNLSSAFAILEKLYLAY